MWCTKGWLCCLAIDAAHGDTYAAAKRANPHPPRRGAPRGPQTAHAAPSARFDAGFLGSPAMFSDSGVELPDGVISMCTFGLRWTKRLRRKG